MNPADLARWASSRTGGQQQPPPPNYQRPAPQAQQLAPPPPGYMWAQIPGVGLACVPIPQQQLPPPVQPPQVVVPYAQPSYVRPPAYPQAPRVETCELMKPDGRDPYADLLASVPSLVPEYGYDATKGNPNPLTMEVAGLPEFRDRGPAVNPDVTEVRPMGGPVAKK